MNRWKIAVCMLCSIIILGACAKKTTNEGEEQKNTINTAGKEENERQSNLDVLQPIAYGNVEGLNLEPGTYITVIGRSSSGSYWKAVKEGAERAVADINSMLGYKGEDKVKLNYSGSNTRNSVDEQINILDEELARYPAAVCIAVIDSNACAVQFDLAKENNIPIVEFDSGSDYPDVMSMVATNNTEAAKTAATKLSDMIDNKGEVALFVHDSISTTAKEREQAFLEEMNKHEEISVVNVYRMDELDKMRKQIADEKNGVEPQGEGAVPESEVTPPETDQQGVLPESITEEEVMQYIFEKNPNIKGCFTTNVDATQVLLKAYRSLEKENEDLAIVGFDGGEDQLSALEQGELDGLVVQNPYGMGYATVVAASRSILQQGNQAVVDSGYIWVTKDNMENRAIKRMLY